MSICMLGACMHTSAHAARILATLARLLSTTNVASPNPSRFFERLAALSKVSSSVLLQLGPEAPLSVVCQLNGGGFCRFFLAPVVEDDRLS